MLEEAQEHRRLHVVDVVVAARRSPPAAPPDAGKPVARVTLEHRRLGQRLEPAVVAGPSGFGRQVLGPRDDAGQRLVVGHDRAAEDVAPDPAVEQLEQTSDVAAAGGHHEARHVVDGVPLAVAERGPHRVHVGPVGARCSTPAGSSVGVLPRLSTATSCAGGQQGDRPAACRRTPNRRAPTLASHPHFVVQIVLPRRSLSCVALTPCRAAPHPAPSERRHLDAGRWGRQVAGALGQALVVLDAAQRGLQPVAVVGDPADRGQLDDDPGGRVEPAEELGSSAAASSPRR